MSDKEKTKSEENKRCCSSDGCCNSKTSKKIASAIRTIADAIENCCKKK